MSTRIYIITPKVTEEGKQPVPRLVRAGTPAQALRHVAQDTLNVTIPTQDDLIAATTSGAKVEDAKAES